MADDQQPTTRHIYPTLVRARKDRGRLVHQYDIYIGPAIENASWKLRESKWHNPFFIAGNVKETLALYRKHIFDTKLSEHLGELMGGRVLACFCNNPNRCHGSVLIELCKERFPNAPLAVLKCRKTKTLFFKGEKAILSNFYHFSTPLRIENHDFCCLYQAYIYKQLLYLRKEYAAKSVLQCTTGTQVQQIWKSISKAQRRTFGGSVGFNFNDNIRTMYSLVKARWDADPEFRQYCCKYKKYDHFVESTSNTFWGSGLDIDSIANRAMDLNTLPGLNLMGWIIKCVQWEAAEDPTILDLEAQIKKDERTSAFWKGFLFVFEEIKKSYYYGDE